MANRFKSNINGNLLFNGVYVPYFICGYGLKTFDHFGAIFYNKFLKDLLFVNFKYFKYSYLFWGVYVHLFLKTFEKFGNKFKFKRIINQT